MAFKYKLKEQPSPNLAKQGNYKIGDVSYSKDGDTKYVVNKIDPETGQVGWKVIPLPAFDKLNSDLTDLVRTAKGVYGKTKDDEKFRDFYEEIRKLRNQVRTHLRNEYPDEYKRMSVAEDVDEISTSAGAGAYLTKYAFKKPKKQKKLPENINLPSMDDINLQTSTDVKLRNYIKDPQTFAKALADIIDELLDDENQGSIVNPEMKRALQIIKKEAEKDLNEGVGATLGPGPKAGPDGVKDNYYVKKFKYKLVPKKKGTYVQKGSGLEVKKLF